MSTKTNTPETAATWGFPITTAAAAEHSLVAYKGIKMPEFPGAEHSTSLAGGYALGVLGGYLTERLARRVDTSDNPRSAERLRKLGWIMTSVGVLACQVTIEWALQGVSDPRDVLLGTIAATPGLVAGRQVTRPLPTPTTANIFLQKTEFFVPRIRDRGGHRRQF